MNNVFSYSFFIKLLLCYGYLAVSPNSDPGEQRNNRTVKSRRKETERSDSDSVVSWVSECNVTRYQRRITYPCDCDFSRRRCREVCHQQQNQVQQSFCHSPIHTHRPRHKRRLLLEIGPIHRVARSADNHNHQRNNSKQHTSSRDCQCLYREAIRSSSATHSPSHQFLSSAVHHCRYSVHTIQLIDFQA